MATGFVRMALDEFYAHDISNWTGLLTNYWTIVENDIAGEQNEVGLQKIIIKAVLDN